MQTLRLKNNPEGRKKAAQILKRGGVGVLPTDTLYGIVGSALNKKTVESIYKLRQRTPTKPLIVLISGPGDLKRLNIEVSPEDKKILKRIWPNKVSVVQSCPAKKLSYLHRGTFTLALRLPKLKSLTDILRVSGPLVAPSANIEGQKEALTIKEAEGYFGEKINFYLDAGPKNSKPSTLIRLENGKTEILRQGAVRLKLK